jgi:hypothetical protein
MLLFSAHRLPAPIVEEEKPTPAPEQSEAPKPKTKRPTKSAATSEEHTPAKAETRAKPASQSTSQGPARSTPGKQKSVEASGSNSARRFDGIWQGSWQGSYTKNYIVNAKYTLTVRGKSAELIADRTFSFLNRPSSRVRIKATNHSDDAVAHGSDLAIQWRGYQVVDWEPKTFTRKDAEEMAGVGNKPTVFTLNGDELVTAGGTIYHRVK